MPISLNDKEKSVGLEKLVIEDPDFYSYLKDLKEEQREPFVRKSIEIGYEALKRAGAAAVIDLIEKEFTKFLGDAKLRFESTHQDFRERLEKKVTEIFESMDKSFDPDKKTSYIFRFKTEIDEYFKKGGTVETLLDTNKEGTLLYNLRESILKAVRDLGEKIAREEAKEEIVEITPLKGYAFEEVCEETLRAIAKNYSDEIEKVTNKEGAITGSKKGDFISKLYERPDLSIAIEAKHEGYTTEPTVLRTLEEAIKNRNANYGILVTADRKAFPQRMGFFNPYPENKLACAFSFDSYENGRGEILEIAYKFARFNLMTQEARKEGVNIKKVEEGIKNIESTLGEYTTMLKSCTSIKTSAENIQQEVGKLREKLESTRTKIKNSIDGVMGILGAELAK